MPDPNLGTTMDKEFSIWNASILGLCLEILQIQSFPEDFKYPIYAVRTFWRPVGSALVTATAILVNLELIDIPTSHGFCLTPGMLPILHVFLFRGVSADLDLIQASESLGFSAVS
jgi:hypothetical protein